MWNLANLENLDGAMLVKVYTSQEGSERVYAWFGSTSVSIYDGELNGIDIFTFPMSVFDNVDGTRHHQVVDRLIEEHEDAVFDQESFTDDIFVNYEFDHGEDLEVQ